MREPNIITIVTTILPGQDEALARFLNEEIDTTETGGDNRFPFSAMPNLHFCSFCILEQVEDLPAYLVMEATFDGPEAEFLADLAVLAAGPLARIFSFCAGFPDQAVHSADLMGRYMSHRVVRNNAVFSGSPGRTAAQIRAEHRLRLAIGRYLDIQAGSGNQLPSTYDALMGRVRRMVRSDPKLQLAEEAPRTAKTVARAPLVLRALVLIWLAIALLTGYALVRLAAAFWSRDWGFQTALAQTWSLFETDAGPPLDLTTLTVLIIWLLMLSGELIQARQHNPHDPRFWIATSLAFTRAMRKMAGVATALLGIMLALSLGTSAPALAGLHDDPGPVLAFWLGLFCAAPFLVFARGALRRQVAIAQPGGARAATYGRLALGATGLAKAGGLVLLVPLYWLADLIFSNQALVGLGWFAALALALTLFAGLGAFAWLTLRTCLGIAVRGMEIRDAQHFTPARHLLSASLGRSHVWAREEHRTNRLQNHFASVTFVKRGLLRQILLRLVLRVIDLVALYRDHSGTLGGIPTIHSARWVLLDKGRRLLFLTNYVGAWDSYLNEFSELAAVSGVNAIWTNTFVRLNHDQSERFAGDVTCIGFPETRYLLNAGARDVPAFKAYVRQSQIPTQAWYSAYPDLSVPDVNGNTDLRRTLFADPSLADSDAFLERL